MSKKNLPWWAQPLPEEESENAVNSPKEKRKDQNRRVEPPKEKQEGIDKTNQSMIGKNVSVDSKKLEKAAASVESNKAEKSFVVIPKAADSKNLETSSTKSEKAVEDSPLQDLAEVKAQKKKEKELIDNTTEQQSLNNLSDVLINKSRRRKKGSTPISKVIENELQKQNEQTAIKDKKNTTLTTEIEKKPPDTEALKPEAGKKDQDTWTIDKVPKKTDEVIGQKVEKKLSDSVTAAKTEKDKKVLDPSNSEMLKNKQKNQTSTQPPKKEIDETSALGGKPENKLATSTSKTQLSGNKPTSSLNSPTVTRVKTNEAYFKHAVNIKSLESSGKLIDKKGASETQKPNELQVKEVKKDSKGQNISEKSKSPIFTNKFDLSKSTGGKSPILKKSGTIKSKDIPNHMKPIEKKKDGTLIDYGLKVSSRKSTTEDFRKSNSTKSKQQLIAGTIKEEPKKEKSLTSGEEKKVSSKPSWESFQFKKAQEELAPKNKAEFTEKWSKSSNKEDHSSKDMSSKNVKITSPNLKSESVKLNSPEIKKGVNSAPISTPKAKETYFQVSTSSFSLAQPEESQWIAQSASALKPNVLKMTLQLEEFEENHIFSGADHRPKAED